MDTREAYHELSAYTLAHGDASFIHQHVVDAFVAQNADASTKPIAVTFALAGLYLRVEKRHTGRYVQRAHQKMAQRKRSWPSFTLPRDRGAVTAIDVMAVPAGPRRDAAIDGWCASVWAAYRDSRPIVEALLDEYGLR